MSLVEEGAEDGLEDGDEVSRFNRLLLLEKERQKLEAGVLSSSLDLMSDLFEGMQGGAEFGKSLSRAEREGARLATPTLSYSEVQHDSFHSIFTRLNRLGFSDGNEGTFVDVGSGVGRVVFAVALFHTWKRVIGIEILSSLHKASLSALERWKSSEFRRHLSEKKQDTDVRLLLGDALTMHWASDADVAFINATCFSLEMVHILGVEACRMRTGSILILTTHQLDAPTCSKYLEQLEMSAAGAPPLSMNLSCGPVRVFFYRRTKAAPLDSIGDPNEYVKNLIEHGMD